MTKFEYAWMIVFGILAIVLMVHEQVFNGLIIIPLVPLIIKGIDKVTSC